MKIINLVLSSILSLIISCSKKESETNVPPLNLIQAQELWLSKGIDSYSYTQTRSCFCLPEHLGPNKLIIENDLIVSVDGELFDVSIHQGYLTINQSFKYIMNNLENDPEEFNLEFDLTYGFPRKYFLI